MKFALAIIAIIIGMALFRQFDFETLRFEKPGLGILYLLVFVASIFLLIRGRKKTEHSDD
jgi:hypothetical protein